MAATLNFSAWTPIKIQGLFDAVQAELLARVTGSIAQGSSASQSYSLTKMSDDALSELNNGLTAALGFQTGGGVVGVDFSGRGRLPNSSTFGA